MSPKKLFALAAMIVSFGSALIGQTLTSAQSDEETAKSITGTVSASDRVTLAMSVTNYPMTPGDALTVAYLSSMGSSTITVMVDANYVIDLGFFGSVDARGRSFLEVRATINDLVRRGYPSSYPRVTLVGVGRFLVPVDGAVLRGGDAEVWRLVRLSEVVAARIAPYGSERYVTLRRADGTSRTYDLFLARRDGSLVDDPYLAPGDSIRIGESMKRVTIGGQVERAGTYEVLPTESIERIVSFYGGGVTARADTGRMRITRYDARAGSVSNLVLDYTSRSVATSAPRRDDVIVFDSLIERLAVIYLEGAVAPPETGETTTPTEVATERTGRVRLTLYEEDTLYTLLARNRDEIAPGADLASAFLRREGSFEPVAVDLERLLYRRDLSIDLAVRPGDRIIVPFGTVEVFVAGEVIEAGYFRVDPLTRLSLFLEGRLTAYASLRNVHIEKSEGPAGEFDLFLAERFGRIEEDPYLEAGDVITVGHLGRKVTVSGEVERPGVYELLAGEELAELIRYYAAGSSDLADLGKIEVIRANTGSETPIERNLVDLGSPGRFGLRNLDTVIVPNRLALLPVVYLEGAILPDPALQTGAGTPGEAPAETPTRMRVILRSGETLYTVLRAARGRIDERGDLSRGFLRRDATSQTIEIDMERLLYQHELSRDLELQGGDRIIVPYGAAEVFLTGEVSRSQWITIEPLTRLSGLIAGKLTPYSSTRRIVVTSPEGDERAYDLFLAERFGRKEEDPYLQSGDTINVMRAERKVTLGGEVERPGTYELLPGEILADLITFYGRGLTINANPQAIEIVDSTTVGGELTRKLYVDFGSEGSRVELADRDAVLVPTKLALLPYVFFEGAVMIRGDEDTTGTELVTTSRFRYRFHSGELLSEALTQIEGRFSPESDLANAYLIRENGERKHVDMEALLRRSETAENFRLEPYDRFVVPFKQYFVIVSGAVRTPGRYPYIPDRNYLYYVNLAGGFDTNLHVGAKVQITDIEDRPLRTSALVEPETKIYAPINNPFYFVNQLSGVIGVIGTIISILAVSGVFGGG